MTLLDQARQIFPGETGGKITAVSILLSAFSAVLSLGVSGCATKPVSTPPSLNNGVARSGGRLSKISPLHCQPITPLSAKSAAGLETSNSKDFASNLKKLGVAFSAPVTGLPLILISIPAGKTAADATKAGIPVILGYDTTHAPASIRPRAIYVDGTAIYDRSSRTTQTVDSDHDAGTVQLHEHSYALAVNPVAATDLLKLRARALAKSGFSGMIRPESAKRKPHIYLIDPYDPRKTPLLMVHGLQSTPVSFAKLVEALRSDPEVRAKYQIQGILLCEPLAMPLMSNSAELRDNLDVTLRAVDPEDHDAATKRIVVIGHSMGGIMARTLVCSSGERIWDSFFRVPAAQLKGDAQTIQFLVHVFHFQRNPRVQQIIFMAGSAPGAARWRPPGGVCGKFDH